eukprot:NODE_3989_length_339_cov_5.825472_g3939_i0.p1 GENE.NODE_3989_length_339_cov_5.825472_g3939_i0~~NODE_3989_length_339_cov_5.825472_g3939_i0.p1  ORF type:complete len:102 (-),score=27.80 NODE_3989_length_339_cov_5.825472_g3939_i0:33-317(-)
MGDEPGPPPPPPPAGGDLPDLDEGRSGLLESIRNAGGIAKLKKSKDRRVKEKKPEKGAPNLQMSMMDQIQARMQERRKGISDKRDEADDEWDDV